jgi:hypothetical protein
MGCRHRRYPGAQQGALTNSLDCSSGFRIC